MQPAYKVVQIQGMSAYSVRSPGPDSCVCIGIGTGESRLYDFSGYRGGPEPVHIGGLHCSMDLDRRGIEWDRRSFLSSARSKVSGP